MSHESVFTLIAVTVFFSVILARVMTALRVTHTSYTKWENGEIVSQRSMTRHRKGNATREELNDLSRRV
jgi:hypothetical protein